MDHGDSYPMEGGLLRMWMGPKRALLSNCPEEVRMMDKGHKWDIRGITPLKGLLLDTETSSGGPEDSYSVPRIIPSSPGDLRWSSSLCLVLL